MKSFRQFLKEDKKVLKEAKINSFSDNIMLEAFGIDLFVKVIDNFNDVVIKLSNKDYKINNDEFINPFKKFSGSKLSELSDKEILKLDNEHKEKLEKEEKEIFNEIMKIAQKFDAEVIKIIKKHKGKI